jgi:SHS2 domain-containing protein
MQAPRAEGGSPARTEHPRATHHYFEEHTSEIRLRIEARSVPELFAEAARALGELALGGPLPEGGTDHEENIALCAPDKERLLLAWLDELIFRTETEHDVFVSAEFDALDERHLSTRVCRREVATELRTLVKAATMHDLKLTEDAHGFSATVVLDV